MSFEKKLSFVVELIGLSYKTTADQNVYIYKPQLCYSFLNTLDLTFAGLTINHIDELQPVLTSCTGIQQVTKWQHLQIMPGQYRFIRNTGGRLMDEPVMVNVTGNMHIYTLCPECLQFYKILCSRLIKRSCAYKQFINLLNIRPKL